MRKLVLFPDSVYVRASTGTERLHAAVRLESQRRDGSAARLPGNKVKYGDRWASVNVQSAGLTAHKAISFSQEILQRHEPKWTGEEVQL